MRFATEKTIRACEPVVAPVITWGPCSPSHVWQYSPTIAARVLLAFFRAMANSAVVKRRVPSWFLNPNNCTRKNTWAACSSIVGFGQFPSTWGSFSAKSHTSFACHVSNRKGASFPFARFRSSRNRLAASRIHTPNRLRFFGLAACLAYALAIPT